jgi:tetratricopeptide (TPR) repeat protein
MDKTKAFRSALSCFALFALQGCLFYHPETWVDRAVRLQEEGKPHQAYSEYISHIESRLDAENRKEDENPFFYFILIGDAFLEAGDYRQALVSYAIAHSRDVQTGLVSDRVYLVAKRYSDAQEFDKAWEILKKYRFLDPLSFDYRMSELHRQMVQFEQEQTD